MASTVGVQISHRVVRSAENIDIYRCQDENFTVKLQFNLHQSASKASEGDDLRLTEGGMSEAGQGTLGL